MDSSGFVLMSGISTYRFNLWNSFHEVDQQLVIPSSVVHSRGIESSDRECHILRSLFSHNEYLRGKKAIEERARLVHG